MVRAGAVRGARANCRALLAAGEAVLVYPGGGREVAKRKGEENRLTWKRRTGFARMAIEHQYPVVPFASLGADFLFASQIMIYVSGVAVLVLSIAFTLALCGFYTLQPNEGAILQLFGAYRGTSRVPGLRDIFSVKRLVLQLRRHLAPMREVFDRIKKVGPTDATVLVLGMVGAALFYGDAVITPAISVLSAVEGLVVVLRARQVDIDDPARPFHLRQVALELLAVTAVRVDEDGQAAEEDMFLGRQ